MPSSIEAVPNLVSHLYSLVDELEGLFPGRKFTPDGHLVGSIGEVMAASIYNLSLLPASAPTHDAITTSGILVQIKASQGSGVAMREEPQHLLVLHLNRRGGVTEIYNGPGSLAWQASGAMQRNGQRAISFARLKSLMANVKEAEKLPVNPCA